MPQIRTNDVFILCFNIADRSSFDEVPKIVETIRAVKEKSILPMVRCPISVRHANLL
jgi:GTPase SAR1 family protein